MDKEILKNAINLFGKENQIIVAIEELSELQKELTKYYRNGGSVCHIAEEIADVEIMLEQLKIIFPVSPIIESYKIVKVQRLKESCEEYALELLIDENDRS